MSDAACERCGTFAALTLLAGKNICQPCIERLRSTAVYSRAALARISILLNPTAGMAMLAMNYRFLGDKERAQQWGVGAAVLGVLYVVLMNFDIPNGAFLGANIGLGLAVSRAWQPDWEQVEKAGFQKRNPWWVVLVTLAVIVAVVLLLTGIELARAEA